MVKVNDIFSYLCELAPLELQMDFDNSGFLVGHGEAPVTRALLALDITEDVICEAEDQGAQLIISHHPLIFGSLKSVTEEGPGGKTLSLIEKGLAAVCMHTNLDIAKGGVNDVLMTILGATVQGPLDADGCGRIGLLEPPEAMQDFLARCKRVLNANGLRYHDAGREVYRLAVMGGSGGGSIQDAVNKGCDTYVTSDIKYHQFLDAAELDINLIDADHFCTENPIIPVLAGKLSQRFPEVEFLVSQRHKQLIRFY